MAANYANYANGAVRVIGVIRGRNISFAKIDERSRLAWIKPLKPLLDAHLAGVSACRAARRS